jgi:hypothetical protein
MKKVMTTFMQEFKFYRQIKELGDITSTANKYSILDIQSLNEDSLETLKV